MTWLGRVTAGCYTALIYCSSTHGIVNQVSINVCNQVNSWNNSLPYNTAHRRCVHHLLQSQTEEQNNNLNFLIETIWMCTNGVIDPKIWGDRVDQKTTKEWPPSLPTYKKPHTVTVEMFSYIPQSWARWFDRDRRRWLPLHKCSPSLYLVTSWPSAVHWHCPHRIHLDSE